MRFTICGRMWHSYVNIQSYENFVKIFKCLFICVHLCACLSVCAPWHTSIPQWPKEGITSPGTGKTDSCEPLNVLRIQRARAASVINCWAISLAPFIEDLGITDLWWPSRSLEFGHNGYLQVTDHSKWLFRGRHKVAPESQAGFTLVTVCLGPSH